MQILIPLLTSFLILSRSAIAEPQVSISIPVIPGVSIPPDAVPPDASSPDSPDANGSNIIHSVSGPTTLVIPATVLSDTTQIISGEQVPGQPGKTAGGGGGDITTPTLTPTSSTPPPPSPSSLLSTTTSPSSSPSSPSNSILSFPQGSVQPDPAPASGANSPSQTQATNANNAADTRVGHGLLYAAVAMGGALFALV